MKFFLFACVVILLFSCGGDTLPKYEDYNEDDFRLVPGIITGITRTPIAKGIYYKYNAEYAYNIDSDTILTGKEMDIDLAIREGDGIYVLVHKYNDSISFLAGARLTPKDQIILKNYLKKSEEHGVEYYGVE